MIDSLATIKKLISSKYLGKEGIHGIGISRSKKAVRIYFEQNSSLQQKETLEKIKNDATPYEVLIIEGKKSTIT